MVQLPLGRFDSFKTVLGLLVITFVLGVGLGDGSWGRLVVIAVQCLTLLVALTVSRARPIVLRVAYVATVVAVAVGVLSLSAEEGRAATAAVFLVSGLLAGVGPLAVWAGLKRRTSTITIETVAGALSIYLMLGLTFAFAYSTVQAATGTPFFVQLPDGARAADTMYFSFVTISTTGYGDLSAGTDYGRSIAVLEAVLGQLYLVTVVAVVIGNIGRGRREPDQPLH